ncbi:MAG: class I SAM-dependent methyltransferase [Alphaproteobacteria bacterium]|nr:class I SAM-dependent methyltransferase [Alphaproteobacteria bacterium]
MSTVRLYLDLLKAALLNELFLDHEVQIFYLFDCLEGRAQFDPAVFSHSTIHLKPIYDEMARCRAEGRPFRTYVPELPHSMIGRKRLDHLERCLETIERDRIAGDLLEAGVWRGGACIFMRGFLKAHEVPERVVWVADSFAGLPVPSLAEDQGYDLSATRFPALAVPLETVRAIFGRYGLLDDRVRFLEGWFKDTLPTAPVERLALLRLDGDLYESTIDTLTALYDRVAPGGFIVVDDYFAFEPCRRATDEFRADRNIHTPFERIDWSGVCWRKT